ALGVQMDFRVIVIALVLAISGCQSTSNKKMEDLAKVAEGGDNFAQYLLGYSYERGDGNPKDLDKAKYWYSKSIEQGNGRSAYNLAILILSGSFGTPDVKKAIPLLTLAAQQKHERAPFDLGVLYYKMGGPENVDLVKGYAWLQVTVHRKLEDQLTAKSILSGLNLSTQQMQDASKYTKELIQKYG
ncbi:tetratricopeptide repeat protein, partial [Pseudoalteromonas arctica]